ncbi:MAG: putative DNA-binding domain-containing protein [Pseudorhodobacter sp.]
MTGEAGFVRALLDPAQPPPAELRGPGGRPAGRRFDVYRNNVAASLTEALRAAFPAVQRLLGDAYFTALAVPFLRAHPPRSGLMMVYGAAFPDFIAGFPPLAHLPWLADVARLEQLLRESHHAADAVPIARSRLAGLDPAALLAGRIVLAPAVRLLRSDWPVQAIWSANLRGTMPPSDVRAEAVLVLRPGFDAEPQVIPGDMAVFLDHCLRGASVSMALDAAGTEVDLGACLGTLLAGGGLLDIREE